MSVQWWRIVQSENELFVDYLINSQGVFVIYFLNIIFESFGIYPDSVVKEIV